MWDKIKKAINSDLSKPLNTFIQEIHNSWATQRNRLDTNISSRATDAGVWNVTTTRALSYLVPTNSSIIHSGRTVTVSGNTNWHSAMIFRNGSLGGVVRFRFHLTCLGANFNSSQFPVRAVVNGISTDIVPLPNVTMLNGNNYDLYIDIQLPVNAIVHFFVSSGGFNQTAYSFNYGQFRVCADTWNNLMAEA